jgi:hypothetical protein
MTDDELELERDGENPPPEEELPPGLMRAVRADPDHSPELLMRFAVERLAADAASWAARTRAAQPDAHPRHIAERIRGRTNLASLTEGAISGTPFFLALVPAYVAVLWDQAWMTLRIAALYGRDPQAPGMAAELLVLRGVHPTIEEAQAALDALGTRPPKRFAGGWRALYRLGLRIMVLAGFIEAPGDEGPPPWPKRILLWTFAGVLYAITFIVPLSFMIVMAQSCSLSTRRMGASALALYAPEGETPPPMPRRHRVRTLVLAGLGAGLPIVALAWINNASQNTTGALRAVGALLGLSIVITLYAISRRPLR